MELVREGRVAPIPRTTRGLSDAQRTLDDLAEGTIVGRVVLTP
jgi:D-arabinose 1-dehydrogenase-like Zn-dependent alcohol dehydrogenase